MDPVVAALLGVAGGALGAAILIALVRGFGHALGTWLRVRIMGADTRARFPGENNTHARRPGSAPDVGASGG